MTRLFDESLNRYLEEDSLFGSCICQYIVNLSEKLTFNDLVTNGTLQMLENMERKAALRIIDEELPVWMPKVNWYINVVTRASADIKKYPAYVVIRAYVEAPDND